MSREAERLGTNRFDLELMLKICVQKGLRPRGPLSLVSTSEELLGRKVAAHI
jgi:hypothetical protein